MILEDQMKQNQYLVPAAILALAIVILIVAFKPNKESVSDGMSKETTTLATPSARGGVTAPEMLPLLAKVTELTEKTVQSQNEAQLAKNQAEQLASRLSATNQALEMSQQEVARLAKIIQDGNDRSIKIGMHIDEAVRKIGSSSEILEKVKATAYDDTYRWVRVKYSLGNLNSEGREQEKSRYTLSTESRYYCYKYPDKLIKSDMESARRQDPNMNKNDDQAWLIGNQWIFIDKNKIITSTGPSQYDFK